MQFFPPCHCETSPRRRLRLVLSGRLVAAMRSPCVILSEAKDLRRDDNVCRKIGAWILRFVQNDRRGKRGAMRASRPTKKVKTAGLWLSRRF